VPSDLRTTRSLSSPLPATAVVRSHSAPSDSKVKPALLSASTVACTLPSLYSDDSR
jgi:hypothetical protein